MRSVRCISLGCFKNRVDSEKMLGALAAAGVENVGPDRDADVILINTCAFIESATNESISVLLDAAEAKEQGRCVKLIAAGCLVNRYGEEQLAAEMPEVDAWIRCEDHGALVAACGGRAAECLSSRRSVSGGREHVRYLKLMEGCSSRCAYCAIPSIRGGARSLEPGLLIDEACRLADDGAREICLVAQDLTIYGRDLGGSVDLVSLLSSLDRDLPKDIWIRLLYLNPSGVDRRLLERIASSDKILHYLDIPIQHASPRILRAMRRPLDGERLRGVFSLAREIMPDAALRTTCMVGFPGETRADVDTLVSFLGEVRFDRMGAFEFSPEEGTEAASMPDQVSKRTKRRRFDRVMSIQEMISAEIQASFVGRDLDVIVDSVASGRAEGRSYREAPEVDGVIDIDLRGADAAPGDRMRVTITGASEHDLEGVPA